MSLLTICQDAADLVGIPRPASVISSTDTQIRRLLALANIEGRNLARRYPWEALLTEASFTTVATTSQGTLTSIASDIDSIVNRTMWNRDMQDRIAGAISPQDWQEQLAVTDAGPYYDFRIRGGDLLLYPTPPAGDTIFFEYKSKNWCEDSGGTGQANWAADDDVGRLDEHLMTLGLRWRFLQAQGFDYGEAFRDYEMQVNEVMAKDGGKRVMMLNEGTDDLQPSARAPDGSWNL